MLSIQKLQSGYLDQEILHSVDLVVNPGKIVAIIGPNGSGKSTALKSIFNQTKIFSGKIIFNNVNITNFKTHKLILEGVSYVPQGRQVFPDLTVKENLEMGSFTVNDKTIVRERLKKIFLQFPMLEEKQDEYAFALSGGQQQILAIARALMQEPKLLLLDEPSLGLSPKATDEIFEIIGKLNKQGMSILIVEQNAKKATEIAHRTYILEDGEIALHGGKEILKNKKIKEIYFGGR